MKRASKTCNLEVDIQYVNIKPKTKTTLSSLSKNQDASYSLILNVLNPNEKPIDIKRVETWLHLTPRPDIETSMIHHYRDMSGKVDALQPRKKEYLTLEGDSQVNNELLEIITKPVGKQVYATMIVEGETTDGERATSGYVVKKIKFFAVTNNITYNKYDPLGTYA